MVIYKRRFSCPCKESVCSVGDLDSIPGLGRSPGEGKGYPLQYSGLENSMNSIVHGVTKSRTQLSNFHFHYSFQNGVQGKASIPYMHCFVITGANLVVKITMSHVLFLINYVPDIW